jgi:catechol 2,3-dioxygenase-like lactoylglutathione lyase family enzyme
LIFCLAGYAICIPIAPFTLLGEDTKSQAAAVPKIDHILLEVSNLNASIAFYRDFLGLRLKSQSDWFVMLESNNVGVFLRNSRWRWEKPRASLTGLFDRGGGAHLEMRIHPKPSGSESH